MKILSGIALVHIKNLLREQMKEDPKRVHGSFKMSQLLDKSRISQNEVSIFSRLMSERRNQYFKTLFGSSGKP